MTCSFSGAGPLGKSPGCQDWHCESEAGPVEDDDIPRQGEHTFSNSLRISQPMVALRRPSALEEPRHVNRARGSRQCAKPRSPAVNPNGGEAKPKQSPVIALGSVGYFGQFRR